MIMAAKKILSNHEGQALFEMLAFIPIFLALYAVLNSFGNSINASINQQKVARGYFFSLIDNNAFFPDQEGLNAVTSAQKVALQTIGFAESFDNSDLPVAPCYKIGTPVRNTNDDECLKGYRGQETVFLKPTTMFGLCGGTFIKNGNEFYLDPRRAVLPGACSNSTSP